MRGEPLAFCWVAMETPTASLGYRDGTAERRAREGDVQGLKGTGAPLSLYPQLAAGNLVFPEMICTVQNVASEPWNMAQHCTESKGKRTDVIPHHLLCPLQVCIGCSRLPEQGWHKSAGAFLLSFKSVVLSHLSWCHASDHLWISSLLSAVCVPV